MHYTFPIRKAGRGFRLLPPMRALCGVDENSPTVTNDGNSPDQRNAVNPVIAVNSMTESADNVAWFFSRPASPGVKKITAPAPASARNKQKPLEAHATRPMFWVRRITIHTQPSLLRSKIRPYFRKLHKFLLGGVNNRRATMDTV